MTMPKQKPHRSRQDYGTPEGFLDAVEERFGTITWDVAASSANAVVDGFYSKDGIDAFTDDWAARFTRSDLLWLNPEFSELGHRWAPLVARWTTELPWLRLLMLTPASIGASWFRKHVHRRAMVLGLEGRLTFVGEKDPYPKDCMLSCFGFGVAGFDVWTWQPPRSRVRAVKAA